MEPSGSFNQHWKEYLANKCSENLVRLARHTGKIDKYPDGFTKIFSSGIGDFYQTILKKELDLSQIYIDLAPMLKLFSDSYKASLELVENPFLDKTKDFLRKLLIKNMEKDSEKEAFVDLVIVILETLEVLTEHKTQERILLYILVIYQQILFQSCLQIELNRIFRIPFMPQEKFTIKVAENPSQNLDLTLMLISSIRKILESIKSVNDQNLSNFLSSLIRVITSCPDFREIKSSVFSEITLKKIQTFLIIQKIMFIKNQKKDQQKTFYKNSIPPLKDLVYLSLLHTMQKTGSENYTSFKKDASPLGTTFTLLCNLFSDTYYEEVEFVLISTLEGLLTQGTQNLNIRFINYTLQFIKVYFKNLGLRASRSSLLNNDDSTLVTLLFNKNIFCLDSESLEISQKATENWNKIWNILCKNSKTFKCLNIGILKNLTYSFSDFNYIIKLKEWIAEQLINNNVFIKESIKGGMVEDFLKIIYENKENKELNDNIQALIQIIIFILGMKDLFINYNPIGLTNSICEIIKEADDIYKDVLFKCLGEAIKIVNFESQQIIRDFLEILTDYDSIFKIIMIISGIVRSSKISGDVIWPLCRSGWFITLKSKILKDLPNFSAENQVKLWNEIFIIVKTILFRNELTQSKVHQFEFENIARVLRSSSLDESRTRICEENIDILFEVLFDREPGTGSNKIRIPEVIPLLLTMILYCDASEKMVKAKETFQILMLGQNSIPYLAKSSCLHIALDFYSIRPSTEHDDLIEKITTSVIPFNILPQELKQILSLIQNTNEKKKLSLLQCFEQSVAGCFMLDKETFLLKPTKFFYFRDKRYLNLLLPEEKMPKRHEFSVFFWICFSKLKSKIHVAELQDKHLNKLKIKFDKNSILIIYTEGKKKKFSATAEVEISTREWHFVGISFFNQKVVKFFKPRDNFNVIFNSNQVLCKTKGSLPSSVGCFRNISLGKSSKKSRVLDGRISSFYISSTCLYLEHFLGIKATFPWIIERFNTEAWCTWAEFPVVHRVINENSLFEIVPYMDSVLESGGNFVEKDCERFNGVNLFEAVCDIGGLKCLLSLIDFSQYNEVFALTVIKIILHIIKCPQSSLLIDRDFVRYLALIMNQMPFTKDSIENVFNIAVILENRSYQTEFLNLTQITDLGAVANPAERSKFVSVFMKIVKQNYQCDRVSIVLLFSFIKDLECSSEVFNSLLFSFIPSEINEEAVKGINLLVFICSYYGKSRILTGLVRGLASIQLKIEKSCPLELTLMNALQVLQDPECRVEIVNYLLSKEFRALDKLDVADTNEIFLGISNGLEDNYDSFVVIGIIESVISVKGKLLKHSRQLMTDLVLRKLTGNIDNLEQVLNKLLDHSNKISQKIYKSQVFVDCLFSLFKTRPDLSSLIKNLIISIIVLQRKQIRFHKFRHLLRNLSKFNVNTLDIYQTILSSLKPNFTNPVVFIDFAMVLEECLSCQLDSNKTTYKQIVKDLVTVGKSLNVLQSSDPPLQQLSIYDIRQRMNNKEKNKILTDEIYLKEGGFFRLIIKLILIGISLEDTPDYFEILPEILIANEAAVIPKTKCYSETGSKPTSRDFYDLYIFTELLYILYYSSDPNSLFIDFILIFIVDFSIYEKLTKLVNSLTKEDVSQFRMFLNEFSDSVHPSWRSHLHPTLRENLQKIFPEFDIKNSVLMSADESTTFKIFLGKIMEKLVSFKQSSDNSESLLCLLRSKEWVLDIQVFLTVFTSVRINLSYTSSKFYKLPVLPQFTSNKSYRYDSELWMVILQSLTDWVKGLYESHNRLRNHIKYKFQKFLKAKKESEETEEPKSLHKVRNCADQEKRNLFLRSFNESRVPKESYISPSKPDKVQEGYFESLCDNLEAEIDLIDITEHSSFNIPGGLSRECEMIKIKGSFYGKIEIDQNFLAFYSDGSYKPKSEAYLGSAPDFTKESKVFNYVWHVSEISEVLPRRYIHRPTALEIFLKSGKSYFFNLFSSNHCKNIFQQIEDWKQSGVTVYSQITEKTIQPFTASWKKGLISNFEYLNILNKFANRSTNDLSQYPVFPWILNKYDSDSIDLKDESIYRDLSSPIGALSESCRQTAQKRYEMISPEDEMVPFHHGSHFSTGGSVSYYLIRLEPFTTQAKKIQNDSFDIPDRLFSSVQSAWESCISSNSDVKELIPEFFYLPDFFLNINRCPFGLTQAGKDVSSVVLPNWAKGSALNFIRIHRQALESPVVSRSLSCWIDLIFGFKQTGKPAIEACNVFGPASYLHTFEKLARTSYNVQGIVDEAYFFGQMPSVLFKKPHPVRDEKETKDIWGKDWLEGTRSFDFECHQLDGPGKFLSVFQVGKTLIILKKVGSEAFLVKLKQNKALEEVKLDYVDLVNIEVWPSLVYWQHTLPSKEALYINHNHFALFQDKYIVSAMHKDGSVKLHTLEGALLKTFYLHTGLVTAVAASTKHIFSAGLGGKLFGWSQSDQKTFFGHKFHISSINVQETFELVFSLNVAGDILIHDLRSTECVRKISGDKAKSFAVSPFGLLAVCFENRLELMGLNRFEVKVIDWYSEISQIKFDPTGEVLICSTKDFLIVKEVFGKRMIKKKIETSVEEIYVTEGESIGYTLKTDLNPKIFISVE